MSKGMNGYYISSEITQIKIEERETRQATITTLNLDSKEDKKYLN